MAHYELIVIGAGPGGYEAALHAAKLGKKVAVVEKREAGGTCLNRGCIPTKTLLHSSQIFHDAKHGAHAGIHTDDIRADMTEIFAYKREISQKLSSGIESLFKTAKIDFLRGTALITAPGAVRVTDAEGGANDYTCDDILIATGSVPSRPPIPGLEFAMTSDELLEGCDHLYRSIVIIGGGVIGIEFATFYADLGCEVTVIEGMDRLLPNMDKELGQSLALILKKQGVKVFTNAMVQSVEKTGEDIAVNFTCKEKSETVSGEAVLCAIGRRPYCDGLFADGISVEMNRRSIAVNERYETSIPHIYAIGDVSAKIQLAHVATAQGIACVDLLYGREINIHILFAFLFFYRKITFIRLLLSITVRKSDLQKNLIFCITCKIKPDSSRFIFRRTQFPSNLTTFLCFYQIQFFSCHNFRFQLLRRCDCFIQSFFYKNLFRIIAAPIDPFFIGYII